MNNRFVGTDSPQPQQHLVGVSASATTTSSTAGLGVAFLDYVGGTGLDVFGWFHFRGFRLPAFSQLAALANFFGLRRLLDSHFIAVNLLAG